MAAIRAASADCDLKVLLANPRGFCAGVERAIDIVERAMSRFGTPVYVRHEIVHNRRVVEELKAKGAIFVEELDAVPTGAVTIFSAHGVARVVESEAQERKLQVIDATCPLVAKVHSEGRRYAARGYDVVLIGHRGHAEVEGTIGQIDQPILVVASVTDVEKLQPENPDRIAYITQTTLSVNDTREIIEALQRRFPAIVGPDTKNICYATQNRQNAVRDMLGDIDALIVVGAANSSNSTRLRELGTEMGKPSYLIPDANALQAEWLSGIAVVGLTAGASAPESSVQEVIEKLKSLRAVTIVQREGIVEDTRFKLPAAVA
ncbi:MAG: 4-hydroxy-3-methylbut-2-enyl diphosphate reductase [Rhizobiales bacterium]|nr:4-hydroxy-3-methylbut-2-enyl diphosphate reductase [Hyphomicrobiales bacterium]